MECLPYRRLLWLACAATTVTLSLSACGGGGDGGSPAPTVPAPTPPPPPPGSGQAPTITQAPVETSAFIGQSATFSVGAAAAGAALAYQWQRDGAAIAGAVAASFTTPPLSAADANARFSVVVSANGLSVTSGAVFLRVLPADAASRSAAARAAFGLIGLYAPVTAPLYAVAPDLVVLRPTTNACASGAITAATVGGTAPVAGNLLPTGAATPVDASFSNCALSPQLEFSGNSRAQLLAPAVPLIGAGAWSLTATLNAVRTRSTTPAGVLAADYTASGGLLLQQDATVAGSLLSDTVSATLASGLTYSDLVNGQSLALQGGSFTDALTYDVAGSRPLLRSQRVRMTDVAYVRDGLSFTFAGEASVSYTGSNNTPSAGSGEIVLRSNQLVIARVRGTPAGFAVALDDGGPVTPLSPPRR
jgi:hypothetical protein